MSNTKPTYHIGLCMAGAISAGAYTAGVMDYLFETLDTWEKAKKSVEEKRFDDLPPGITPEMVPMHNVIIDVMGGASAGGITSGLGALAAYTNFKPVTSDLPVAEKIKTQQANLFYNTWVNLTETEGNDMFTQILNPEDLLGGNIYSLLNAGFIEEIAANTVKPIQNNDNKGDGENNNFKRSYINDEMELIVTLTNLNGVPYQINFLSDSTSQNPQYIYNYRDFGHFILNPSDKDRCLSEGIIPVYTDEDNASMQTMRQAMMATGAFPVGLMARTVKRDTDVLQKNQFINQLIALLSQKEREKDKLEIWLGKIKPEDITEADKAQLDRINSTIKSLSNTINKEIEKLNLNTITTINADGGTLNNEPFEVVADILESISKQGRDERKNAKTTLSSVFMIDPFPTSPNEITEWGDELKVQSANNNQSDKSPIYSLKNIVAKLLSTLRSQSLFKKEDIISGYNSDDYSKFIIAPTHTSLKGEKLYGGDAIACGSLHGFGGFLDKEFRNHDFELGRYNCQRFLQEHFALPINSENVIVKGYTKEMTLKFETEKGHCLPIIPDLNKILKKGEKLPERIAIENYVKYEKQVKNRVKIIIKNIANKNAIVTYFINLMFAGKVTETVISIINKNVSNHPLFKK